MCICVCVCTRARHVWLFATPWTVTHQAPLSMDFFQARTLEWIAISFSRVSSWPRDWTHISCVSRFGRQILYHYHQTLENISGRVPQTNGEYKLPLLGEDTRLGSASFSSVGYHALLSPLLQKATLKRGSFIELFHLRILRGALDVHPHSQPAKLLNLFCVSDQRSPASRI